MRKRRYWFIALAAILALVMVPISQTVFAEDVAIVSVGEPQGVVPAEGYNPGDVFTVPITIANNSGFAAAGFTLHYDESTLELTAFEVNSNTIFNSDMFLNVTGNTAGHLQSSDNTQNGVLVFVEFTVLEDAPAGDCEISIGLTGDNAKNFLNWSREAVPVQFVSGHVLIASSEPPVLQEAAISVGEAQSRLGGEEVSIPVSIAANPGFATAIFTVTLEQESPLQLVSIDLAGTLMSGPGIISSYDFTQNANIAFAKSSGNLEGNGVLFNLIVRVDTDAAPGTYEVGIGLKDAAAVNFSANKTNGSEAVPVTFAAGSLEVLGQDVPTVDQLDFTLPQMLTYNGTVHAVSVVPEEGVNGLGAITVYYEGADYVKSTTAPTDAGDYTVTVNIAQGTLYTSADGIVLGTLTIAKAAAPTISWPTASAIAEGSTLSSSTLSGGSTEYGSFTWTDGTNAPSVPGGSYSVTFTPNAASAKNYEPISPVARDIQVVVLQKGDLDMDGYLSALDVLRLLRIVNELDPVPSGVAATLLDVDGDGTAPTMADVLLLLRKAAGLS
jgi:hypothetical protein